MIKEFFANYFLHTADVTFDLVNNSMEVHYATPEPWRITLVETGEHTSTGGRLRHVASYLRKRFLVTYGDGLSDLNVHDLLSFHLEHGRLVSVTAVQPSGKFGVLTLDGSEVLSFNEKPAGDGQWVSGGYFMVERKALDYIGPHEPAWETEPLHRLALEHELMAFRHRGFWAAMDTLRDKMVLEQILAEGEPPWRRHAP